MGEFFALPRPGYVNRGGSIDKKVGLPAKESVLLEIKL
jgi:hypothetical protein